MTNASTIVSSSSSSRSGGDLGLARLPRPNVVRVLDFVLHPPGGSVAGVLVKIARLPFFRRSRWWWWRRR